MIKPLAISILILSPIILYSQVDDPYNYSVISEPLSVLNYASGWALQDNGKWASEPNMIPFSDSRTNRNPSPKKRLGKDNFIKLEIRKILINDQQFNVFIKYYHDGEYDFPVLEEKWRSFRSMEFFVFPSLNLNEIIPDEVEFGTPYAINLDAFCYGLVRDYNPNLVTDRIINKMNSTMSATNVNAANLVIAVWPYIEEGQELVKFKFIKTYNKSKITVYYLDPINADKTFSRSYYETPYFKFNDFIKQADIYNLPVHAEPSDFLSYFQWGIVKYQAGNYDEAMQDFDRALELNPGCNDFMIYSYRGNSKTKLRDFNGAIEDFDKALKLKPTQIVDYSNWIRNYFNRGVAKFYINDLEGACGDWHKAFENGFGIALEYLNKYCAVE